MAKHDSAYDQVSSPSAGTTTPAGKQSGDIKNDALGNPSRFTRNLSTVAEPKNNPSEVVDEQLGTNIELTWRRFGGDKPAPKTDQGFKNNFNNPTD